MIQFEYGGLVIDDFKKEGILAQRNGLYLKLIESLPKFIKNETGIEGSDRFYEIILYRFIYKFVEDIVTIQFVAGNVQLKQSQRSLRIPISDHEYSELRHTDEEFYNQFFSELTFDRELNQSNERSLKLKTKVKNGLFKAKLIFSGQKKKMLLFSEYYPKYWKENYPDYKVISVGLRTCLNGEQQIVDLEIRKRLHTFLKDHELPTFVSNALTFCLPIDLLEGFKENYIEVERYTRNCKVDWMVAGWFSDLWSTIACGIFVEKGSKLSMIQHGGSYGENPNTFVEFIEKRISDQFFSWSQKNYDEKTVPSIPTRLLAFRNKYESYIKNYPKPIIPQYKVLIADCFHYKTLSFGVLIGWLGIKQNIINFLTTYGDGKGTGVLVRLYYGKFARNFDFSKELTRRFPNVTIHDETTPVECDLIESELVYVNYKFSTLRWEANYIGKKVNLLPELEVSAI